MSLHLSKIFITIQNELSHSTDTSQVKHSLFDVKAIISGILLLKN
uniref:Uncharacterized protein n=1 Tax=Colwellia sp. C1 TaxID=1737566 RepID=A0A168PHE0_9GAMM|nr:hypothetical protein [Colwellia sp. C1]